MSLIQVIIDAIKNRQTLSFSYNGNNRIVEPHTVGISKTSKKEVLSCYQIEGGHATSGHDWNLCEISKISNLSLTGNLDSTNKCNSFLEI